MLAAPMGAAVAWVFNAIGCHNIWVADPSHGAKARQITSYTEDDSFDIGELAEHGPSSPATLLTTSEKLASEIESEIQRQLKTLPTADVAGVAWKNCGSVLLVDSEQELISEAIEIASEHVQVLTRNPDLFLEGLTNYGALFLGGSV
jgi:sulfopropanediol 3-dehydrogenase